MGFTDSTPSLKRRNPEYAAGLLIAYATLRGQPQGRAFSICLRQPCPRSDGISAGEADLWRSGEAACCGPRGWWAAGSSCRWVGMVGLVTGLAPPKSKTWLQTLPFVCARFPSRPWRGWWRGTCGEGVIGALDVCSGRGTGRVPGMLGSFLLSLTSTAGNEVARRRMRLQGQAVKPHSFGASEGF
jgi:hypothetical protein